MKKYNLVIFGLLILIISISVILIFREKDASTEINGKLDEVNKKMENNRKNADLKAYKIFDLVKQNQLDTKEIISKLNLQLNTTIVELFGDADKQNRRLINSLDKLESSSLRQINEVKTLIASYSEEVKNKKADVNLLSAKTTVEADYPIQQLLAEGFDEYEDDKFTEAAKIYRNILDIDPTNTEALCYLNASLYYQNPGDSSNFYRIKNTLIPILEGNKLTADKKRTALNVLIGISREERDSASLSNYQETLHQIERGE